MRLSARVYLTARANLGLIRHDCAFALLCRIADHRQPFFQHSA